MARVWNRAPTLAAARSSTRRTCARCIRDPLALLAYASSIAAEFGPARRVGSPRDRQPDARQFVQALIAADTVETQSLLAALAHLAPGLVPPHSARHAPPAWVLQLGATRVTAAASITEPLRDGDDLLLQVSIPGAPTFTVVDHELGTVAKDSFPAPGTIAEVIGAMRRFTDGLAVLDEPPGAVARRIADSLVRADGSLYDFSGDSCPMSRPLLEWAVRTAAPSGPGWLVDEPTPDELDALALQAARAARLPPGPASDVVRALLGIAATTALHDPLRISPTSVEMLLMSRLPRIATADPEWRAAVPAALEAVVRFAHPRRGVPPAAAAATLDAIAYWWAVSPLAASPRSRRSRRARRTDRGAAAARRAAAALVALRARPRDRPLLESPRERRGAVAMALVWIAAEANGAFAQAAEGALFTDPADVRPSVRVKDLAAHFGATASPSTRADRILAALGRSWPTAAARDLGDAALLVSRRRAQLIRERDLLHLLGE